MREALSYEESEELADTDEQAEEAEEQAEEAEEEQQAAGTSVAVSKEVS